MKKHNQLMKFIEDIEELKDQVFEDRDINGYFVIVCDKQNGINVRYSASSSQYPQLVAAVDLMLLDLKNQLLGALNVHDKDEDDE